MFNRYVHVLFSPCGIDTATKAQLGQTDLTVVLVIQVKLFCHFSVCLHAHRSGTSWK